MSQHEQELLLVHLWRENMRLREVDKAFNNAFYFPAADKAVFLHDESRIPYPDDPPEDGESSVEEGENGYTLRDTFCGQWHYGTEVGKRKMTGAESWHASSTGSSDVFREEGGQELHLCKCDNGLTKRDCENHPINKGLRMRETISSQLLYYRLAAVFGMPPSSETDGSKCCWEVELLWVDDEESFLELYDYKGACSVRFEGSVEANKSALKLLEWLASDNVPHECGGFLAGSSRH